ncbi:MAG: PAS domain-containing protein, partial [Phycisphaerales bacterium]
FIHTRYSLDGGAWSEWSPRRSVELETAPGSHEVVVQARTTWAESPKAQASLAFAVPVPVYRQPLVMIPVVGAILTAVISVVMVLVRRASHVATVRANVELRREIAERRKAEEALRAGEERFRLATQATRDAIYDWDIVADRSWRNERYLELFAPDASSSYDPWRARIHPDDRDRVVNSLQACFDGDGHYWGEQYRLRGADGQYVHVMDRGFILRGEDGRPVRMIGAMTDITMAKEAQQALRESEARFDRAVRGSQDGLWDWPDVSDESEWWSPRFFDLLGYQEGAFEASGWRFDALLHPEDQARTRAALRAHLEHKEPYDVEYRLRTREGGYRWFRARGQAEWDEDGRPVRMAGSVQDITVRKQVEEELARHRHHLEELVRRRTHELEQSQARLRLAERLASIGTLAAGIAHEINNPVGGILLAAQNAREALARSENETSLRDCLADIEENARRCGVITGNILQFAKEGHMRKVPYNLNAAVRRGVRMTAAYVDHHGGEVDVQLADRLPEVPLYPLGMEQVVANLIRNAVESATAKARVEIRTEQVDGAVRLVVRDNGGGVAPDQVKHLFDPFYTTRQEKGGIGLGLSIVHGIITEHGGTIEVESQPGEGTVFSIDLPTASTDQTGTEDAEGTGRR